MITTFAPQVRKAPGGSSANSTSAINDKGDLSGKFQFIFESSCCLSREPVNWTTASCVFVDGGRDVSRILPTNPSTRR